MTSSTPPHSLDHMSFEAAMEELEFIVRKLESGQDSLENSIQLYERGVSLKRSCEEKLREATLKVEKITLSREGNIELEELSI